MICNSIFFVFYLLENFTIEGVVLINWCIKSSLLLANYLLFNDNAVVWKLAGIFYPVLVDHFFVSRNIFLEISVLKYG